MNEAARSFTIPAPGERPPGVTDFAADAANARAADPEARRIRDDLLDKVRSNERVTREDVEAANLHAPDEPREDVESIEVELPHGLKVLFGPPPMVSLTIRVAELLGDLAANPVLSASARIMLCVREINGQKQKPIGSMIDVKRMAGLIGDAGLDILGLAYAKFWSPPSLTDLPVLKKNLRER